MTDSELIRDIIDEYYQPEEGQENITFHRLMLIAAKLDAFDGLSARVATIIEIATGEKQG